MSANYTQNKIVLASYGSIGVQAIDALFAQGFRPEQLALLTHYDKGRNRPLILHARYYSIDVHPFADWSLSTKNWIEEFKPDLLLSLHYRDRIPASILEIATLGGINLHPSLLPAYAGCFSSSWAIINNEAQTGFTYHYMTEEFDKGNIVLQKRFDLDGSETAFSIFHYLVVRSVQALEELLRLVFIEKSSGYSQPSAGYSYYPRGVPCDGIIDMGWSSNEIERFIRAMYFPPNKGACLKINGKDYYVNSFNEIELLNRKEV